MKTYRGVREPACHVLVLQAGDGAEERAYELSVPAELLTKAPGPFDWGAGAETPGTHYLAVALLADLLGVSDRAGIKAMLPFLRRFLARLPGDGFEISDTIFHALFSAVGGGARAEANTPPGHRPASGEASHHAPDEPRERHAI